MNNGRNDGLSEHVAILSVPGAWEFSRLHAIRKGAEEIATIYFELPAPCRGACVAWPAVQAAELVSVRQYLFGVCDFTGAMYPII